MRSLRSLSAGKLTVSTSTALIYDTYSESRLRLLGFALSEKLVVLPELCTAYISLTKEDLDRLITR